MEIVDQRIRTKNMQLREVAIGQVFLIDYVPTMVEPHIKTDEKDEIGNILCVELRTGKICHLIEEVRVIPINATVVINER